MAWVIHGYWEPYLHPTQQKPIPTPWVQISARLGMDCLWVFVGTYLSQVTHGLPSKNQFDVINNNLRTVCSWLNCNMACSIISFKEKNWDRNYRIMASQPSSISIPSSESPSSSTSGSTATLLTSASFTNPRWLHSPRHRSARVVWADRRLWTCDNRSQPWLKTHLTATEVAIV